jgi:hypothetical protein
VPKNPISVAIDGERSSFFEWMGAGEFNLEKMGSVMDSSTPYVKKILYGNDAHALYVAFIGHFGALIGKVNIEIRLDETVFCDIPFENTFSKKLSMGCGEGFVEISIPLKKIASSRFDLKIRLKKGGELLQSIPFHGVLTIDVSNRYPGHWFI